MKTDYKILVYSDNIDDVRLCQSYLKSSSTHEYFLIFQDSQNDFFTDIEQGSYDCILVSYSTQQQSDHDFFKKLFHLRPDLPVIILCDHDNTDMAIYQFKNGVSDFVETNTATPEILKYTIEKAVRTHEHMAAEQFENERLLVLVIDDNEDDREVCMRALRKNKDTEYDFVELSSSQHVVETIKEHEFHCILLDYSLPGADGITVLQTIKQHNPFLPVIIMTGQGSEEIAVSSIKNGADNYMVKSQLSPENAKSVVSRAVQYQKLNKLLIEKEKALKKIHIEKFQEEEVLNQIHLIVSDAHRPFEKRMKDILKLGTQYFGLELGIISEINFDDYHVKFASDYTHIKQDQLFSLGNTYCSFTFKSDTPQAWHNAGMSEIKTHPCYEHFGLNAYIGTKIFVNNRPYGTVNFSSKDARVQPFSEREKAFINLISQYLGHEIYRNITKNEREHLIDDLRGVNAELEQFAYQTAHDLKAPILSAIQNLENMQTQLKAEDVAGAQNTYSNVKKSLSQMDALIADILSLTFVSKIKEAPQNLDLQSLIDQSFEKLGHIHVEKNIKVVTDMGCRQVKSHKIRMQLIIDNLISNAVKYYDPAEAEPYIKVSSSQKNNSFYLSVEDNGLGIEPQDEAQLFEMFQRFHKAASFGSGLGLYMVKKSADILGGHIEYNRPASGKGVCFTLSLPVFSSNN